MTNCGRPKELCFFSLFKETTAFPSTRVKTPENIKKIHQWGKTLLFAAVGLHAFRDETGKRALSAEGRSNPDRAHPVRAKSLNQLSCLFLLFSHFYNSTFCCDSFTINKLWEAKASKAGLMGHSSEAFKEQLSLKNNQFVWQLLQIHSLIKPDVRI